MLADGMLAAGCSGEFGTSRRAALCLTYIMFARAEVVKLETSDSTQEARAVAARPLGEGGYQHALAKCGDRPSGHPRKFLRERAHCSTVVNCG